MSKSLMNPPGNESHWEPKYPFDLVVAYEDQQTRGRALRLYDHLAQQLLDDYDFKCGWWKFDHLTDPALREHAVDDAATANMVVVCVQAGHDLPAAGKAWIEDWLPRRENRKSALVALVGEDEAPADNHGLLTYLKSVARIGHMDFFTQSFGMTAPPTGLSVEVVAQRASTVTPLLEEILSKRIPAPRWGINE